MARLKKRADGRYCKQVMTGIENGKKQYKSFYGATSKEAEAKANDFCAALGRGLDASQAGVTFGALCEQYINTKRAQGIGASWQTSLRIYTGYFSALFNLPAAKIKSQDLQAILNNLAQYHNCNKPLGHKTLMEARRAVRAVFDMAMPEIVQYNPAAKTVLPAGAPAAKREPITDAQRQWIIDTPHRAQAAAMIMLYAGLRRGEVCALTWADINLRAATIRVNKSLDFKAGREKGTKTQAGTRVVHMPAILVDYLAAQPRNTLYVVQTARGGRMTDTAWRRMWASYMADLNVKYGYAGLGKKNKPGGLKLKIPEFTAHQLRHTYASMLYMAGVDVLTARDQLGHTDIKTTLAIYTHLDKRYKVNSMDKLDLFLDKSKTSQEIV